MQSILARSQLKLGGIVLISLVGLAEAKAPVRPMVIQDSDCVVAAMKPSLRDKIIEDAATKGGAGKSNEITSEMEALGATCAGKQPWPKARADQALMYTEFRTLLPSARERLAKAGISPKLVEAAFARLSLADRLASGSGRKAEAAGEASMGKLMKDLEGSGITKDQIVANNDPFLQLYLWLVMEGRAKRGLPII